MPDDPTARFAALTARPPEDWPLDEAVLLIAAHAHPGLDVAAEQARLDELAAGVPEPTFDGLRHHLRAYRDDPKAASKLVAAGEARRDERLDVSELAAYTAVAGVILNLDEVVTKE